MHIVRDMHKKNSELVEDGKRIREWWGAKGFLGEVSGDEVEMDEAYMDSFNCFF